MRQKLVFTTVLFFIALLSYPFKTYAEDPIKIIVNGKELQPDVPAMIIDGRTLVPVRFVAEALGVQVEWDGRTNTAMISSNTTIIKLVIDGQAYKNGSQLPLDVPAQIINSRTMVPVRFISEAMGLDVQWDGANKTINIISQNAGSRSSELVLNTYCQHILQKRYGDAYDLLVDANKATISKDDYIAYIIIFDTSFQILSYSISEGEESDYTVIDGVKYGRVIDYSVPTVLKVLSTGETITVYTNRKMVFSNGSWFIFRNDLDEMKSLLEKFRKMA